MKTTKKSHSLLFYLILSILILFVIFALIFGFYDLSISKIVVDGNSPIGEFGEFWGDLPGYGLIGIAVSILITGHLKDIKKQKIGSFLAIIVGLVFCFSGIILNNLKMFLAGLIIMFPTIIFTFSTLNKDWRTYFVFALVIGSLALFNSLILVNLLKIIWGRVRFIDILELGDSAFTPWYLPNKPSIEHTSFPSGHTAMAYIFLPLLFLIKDTDWKKISKISVYLLILCWGFFISITRVIYGVHYASDVLFSTCFTALISIVLYKYIYLKKDLIEKKLGL